VIHYSEWASQGPSVVLIECI